ncbi:MAG: hypothetical protein GY753_18280 [Gammaproteobacteria bacterium]|nr:hypothetical protein [Gammaproteobacteria bacterium]
MIEYKAGDQVQFQLEILEKANDHISFKLYEVTSWKYNSVHVVGQYLEGSIKWDGCSHIKFRDEGYIHLCGLHYWKQHNDVMKWLYQTVSGMIGRFDEDERWN